MKKEISIRTPKTFGCTTVSTAVLQSLRQKFSDAQINVYSEAPDLIEGLAGINKIVNLSANPSQFTYDIDLCHYLEVRKPQTSKPLRHLKEHMFEMTEEQLKLKHLELKRNFEPLINLTNQEKTWANDEVVKLNRGRPLVWLQTASRVKEKTLPATMWNELVARRTDEYTFIDLSKEQYSRRQAIALTKFSQAGITLDTFLLHGSYAVSASRVIVALATSHPEVVCYNGQVYVEALGKSPKEATDLLLEKLDLLIATPL